MLPQYLRRWSINNKGMKRSGVDSLESWVVAAASSAIYLLSAWPMRLGGQLFVSMLDHFETNRKIAAFPFALAYLMRSVSGPFAGYFGVKIGLQTVTLIGTLLCAIGVGGCFFAENIFTVNICLGLIYGVGLGWATATLPEIINQHFIKHRAKAIGLMFGGSGLGAFATPPFLAYILVTFGFITDSGFMSSINFCAFCFACMGLLCLAMVFASDFQATLVVTSILGATIGGNTTGLPGIVTAFFQREKRSMAMASRLIMYAPMSFTMSPFIGYFRGTLGSYDGLLYVLMSLCTICVVLLLMLSKSTNTKITVETNS